jgi:hypothetical protein
MRAHCSSLSQNRLLRIFRAPCPHGITNRFYAQQLYWVLTLVKEQSGLSAADFVASPFDGHPSEAGHRAVARHIVETLGKLWQPPAAEGPPLGQRLVEACDEAVASGWSPDDIAQWALLVLEAKEIAARRRRLRAKSAARKIWPMLGPRSRLGSWLGMVAAQ